MTETRGRMIVGTSGSTDYLRDTSGDRRYWPVTATPVAGPLDLHEEAVVGRLVELTGGRWVDDESGEACDGLHADGAPRQYLCTRCFPGGDLPEASADEHEEDRRDDDSGME